MTIDIRISDVTSNAKLAQKGKQQTKHTYVPSSILAGGDMFC